MESPRAAPKLWEWPLQHNSDGTVAVLNDDNHFEVHLDAPNFVPKEVKVIVLGKMVDVHVEHDAKKEGLDRTIRRQAPSVGIYRRGSIGSNTDCPGDISRSVARSYQLPDDVDPATVKSTLTKDGMLVITACKKPNI